MAIATYADLKASVANWQARSDLTTLIPDAITIAEAKLNRKLGEVLTEEQPTGVINSREIDISSFSMAAPIGLFIIEDSGEETEITPRVDGTYPQSAESDKPKHYSIAGSKIVFNCPLDVAYTFRFKFRQRFALSDTATTNWLLDEHPDIYLAATLVWGGLFTEDDARTAKFSTVLEDGIPEVKAYISRQKDRGRLTIDPGLADIGRCSTFNYLTGQ